MAPRSPPYSALGAAFAVSPEERRFLHRRIGGLAQWSEAGRPLLDLLANAYTMGLADAAEVLRGRAAASPAPSARQEEGA